MQVPLTLVTTSASGDVRMADEEDRVERRSGADRRDTNAVNDPRFWVSVTAVLLTIMLTMLGLAINKLSSIDAAVQGILVATTRQGEEIRTLKEQVSELKTENRELKAKVQSNADRQTDYNFNLSARLKEIEMLLKAGGKE